MQAPDFSLTDQDGITHTLGEYKDKWLVVYFYPKDNTPGCTTEACSFRDLTPDFTKIGVAVVGISKDSPASHKKFAEKYNLPFPILSDPQHTTIKAYGAWGPKKFLGKEFLGTKRNTYIINPEGNIVKSYESVNPLNHSSVLLKDLRELMNP